MRISTFYDFIKVESKKVKADQLNAKSSRLKGIKAVLYKGEKFFTPTIPMDSITSLASETAFALTIR